MSEMKEFLWIPGQGPDRAALERMRSHFSRPREAMGEAWFMGEQGRMFTELLGNLDEISTFDLQKPLEEIANGLICFGRFEEWIAWYHYLLAALMPRAHEVFVDSLVEYLVTCFIAAYRDGVSDAPYPGFREDALLTHDGY